MIPVAPTVGQWFDSSFPSIMLVADKEMSVKGSVFFVLAVLIAIIDVAVPYLVFARTGSFLASFLFWTVITLVVIVAAGLYTRRWREE
jgi:hypothetical protein